MDLILEQIVLGTSIALTGKRWLRFCGKRQPGTVRREGVKGRSDELLQNSMPVKLWILISVWWILKLLRLKHTFKNSVIRKQIWKRTQIYSNQKLSEDKWIIGDFFFNSSLSSDP